MPENYNRYLFYTLPMVILIILTAYLHKIQAYEGIAVYYIRYDVKSSKNRISSDNLLMIPAENEFRSEKFSYIITTGVISARSNENNFSVDEKIRDDALKTVLKNNGLKSVESRDLDTVISYEGMIMTPVKIIKNNYSEKLDNYSYEAGVEFAPIAFPDRWETLHMKYRFKRAVNNFLELFGI